MLYFANDNSTDYSQQTLKNPGTSVNNNKTNSKAIAIVIVSCSECQKIFSENFIFQK